MSTLKLACKVVVVALAFLAAWSALEDIAKAVPGIPHHAFQQAWDRHQDDFPKWWESREADRLGHSRMLFEVLVVLPLSGLVAGGIAVWVRVTRRGSVRAVMVAVLFITAMHVTVTLMFARVAALIWERQMVWTGRLLIYPLAGCVLSALGAWLGHTLVSARARLDPRPTEPGTHADNQ